MVAGSIFYFVVLRGKMCLVVDVNYHSCLSYAVPRNMCLLLLVAYYISGSL